MFKQTVRVLPVAVALWLSTWHLAARADLWAYLDEAGVTHFASEQVDGRYQLFFRSGDAGSLGSVKSEGALTSGNGSARPGVKATGVNGEPAFVIPKRFADLDASKGYKAVQKHMQAAAQAHAVDYELIKAVIAAESGFDPGAVSPKGAVGLMQLMPTTAGQYGVVADRQGRKDSKGKLVPAQSVEQKLVDPQTNIQAGARYLAYLIKLFKGELSLAVAAYNAGEGAVQRAGNKIPNYKETQGYVKTVMGLYEVFKPAVQVVQPLAGAVGKLGGRISGQSGGRVRVELGGISDASGRGEARRAPVAYAQPASANELSQLVEANTASID
ncbi:lytic transglycosylase domain-containing protein [Ottowia thiooxydans]|uniref:lytic transglycosylase domain-containing protein n=1 Tax=Ottowia thiooxydans TaxID=219182 RepID=UPI001FE05287|nr:lytic transglycosylase domain-containing protein [Ottowia thiooxydans]